MDVYIIGLAVRPPAERVPDLRLEEMVYETARAALDDAAVTRAVS
jgi:acetyl-CoA acyltransferase